MGRAEAIQAGVEYFQRYHCLSVGSVGTWNKRRFQTLKTNLATYCHKSSMQPSFFSYAVCGFGREMFTNSDLGRAEKSLEPPV